MPLVTYSLRAVVAAVTRLQSNPVAPPVRVLCLACPDVIVSPADLRGLIGPAANELPVRPDSAGIIAWHKAAAITPRVVDTAALFAALGCELDVVDVAAARGGERLHDLSEPLPPDLVGRYDLVYDNISHQCFNVARAWANAVAALRVGGYLVSVTPANGMVNNGFWTISPTAYVDFFAANGVDLVAREAVRGSYGAGERVLLPGTTRARGVPEEVLNVVTGRRVAVVDPPVWPVMTKFRTYPLARRGEE